MKPNIFNVFSMVVKINFFPPWYARKIPCQLIWWVGVPGKTPRC